MERENGRITVQPDTKLLQHSHRNNSSRLSWTGFTGLNTSQPDKAIEWLACVICPAAEYSPFCRGERAQVAALTDVLQSFLSATSGTAPRRRTKATPRSKDQKKGERLVQPDGGVKYLYEFFFVFFTLRGISCLAMVSLNITARQDNNSCSLIYCQSVFVLSDIRICPRLHCH